ncbi:MAG TPA: hypothetical protein PLM33_10850 [Acidobacteriota bacterium]|nr:hypothetical protein [Acidobacteriota bacterium]HRR56404.1 hypothetical protein [Acidobacteriota bacterium]HRV09311.1 hypothetical protein [Acidobacteriota bacterium]
MQLGVFRHAVIVEDIGGTRQFPVQSFASRTRPPDRTEILRFLLWSDTDWSTMQIRGISPIPATGFYGQTAGLASRRDFD